MFKKLLIAARLFFGVLTLVAIGKQLSIHLSHHYDIVNFFSYFTNLSNLFAAAVLLIGAGYLLAGRTPGRTFTIVRGAATLYMAVVGVVFSLLLRNVDLGSLLPWINALLHYVMPVLAVADWLLDPPAVRLRPKEIRFWLIAPIVYLAYSLIRGAHMAFYPYPFLNPSKSGGYLGVSGYCLAIVVIFVGFAWALLWLGNWRRQNQVRV